MNNNIDRKVSEKFINDHFSASALKDFPDKELVIKINDGKAKIYYKHNPSKKIVLDLDGDTYAEIIVNGMLVNGGVSNQPKQA